MSGRTYANPVHDGYLGDPFVLKHNGEYYAYGTVPLGDLTVPVLHSRDLVNWRPLGNALALRDDAFEALWAPEVAYHDGAFFMYYSAGGEEGEGHRLRVAISRRPEGPFEDTGAVLTPDEPFAIDAHPFRDLDGVWHLYYCHDFLDEDGGRVGTGIVVDRLEGMTRLAGERRTVVRPHADWQVYERGRRWYGRVWDWHTVEGPSVRERDGRYYCFYSGGAWREPNYGVSYAVSDNPLGPFSPATDAEGPGILRTLPGRVIGPGHASIIRAPDNLHDHIVYHAWDPDHTKRLMRVDRLDWDEGRPYSPGPTETEQPIPPTPAFRDSFDGADETPPDPGSWRAEAGNWRQRDGQLLQHDAAAHPAILLLSGAESGGDFLLEANLRLLETGGETGGYGLVLGHGEGRTFLLLAADGSSLTRDARKFAPPVRLPVPAFDPRAYHQLLLKMRDGRAEVWLDGARVARGLRVPGLSGIGLCTRRARAAFDGIALTLPT